MNAAVLGGKQLHEGDSYIVSLVAPENVSAVADALEPIDEVTFRRGYNKIDPEGYDDELGDEDFEYTWENFRPVISLFRRAANSGRAIIFTVDC